MKVSKLSISNFRGIKESTLYFNGHVLLVGRNNIGKSTICEALDLVLGPDRINRPSAIDEYDFYNGEYILQNGELVEINIEVVLIDISEELKSIFRSHLEFWHMGKKEILQEGEIEDADEEHTQECLRIKFVGNYDKEEDEFVAKTFYSHSPNEEEGVFSELTKFRKRQIGFLYLRAIRTGSRALSLEQGSLLDILLRVGEMRPKFWEETRGRLKDLNPPLEDSIGSLRKVLDNIEKRIGQYIALPNNHKATTLHVSQLTRDHLRKTLAFFMSSSINQSPVPFQKLGNGTLSTLVFALLSAIAELKKENIIFAMEEPEISIPPHTQRRIINYLINTTTQSFVTSHSPYVIEKFDPQNIMILSKDEIGIMKGKNLSLASGLKSKNYRRKIRHSIAEVILGNAVIVGEGLTELEVLTSASKILEKDFDNYPIDLSGVTIFEAGGDGTVLEFGKFFKSIGLKTYAFFDYLKRTPEEIQALQETFDFYTEIPVNGIEKLLINEVPITIQWDFLKDLKKVGEFGSGPFIPDEQPIDDLVKSFTLEALKQKKGERRSADLVEMCNKNNLPPTLVTFFHEIYNSFPQPEHINPIDFSSKQDVENSEEE
ncbi:MULTISPECIES: ATP-dependent nuclease [Aequorivita]|uniref:AAA family ATPase n=1 Tax=Aequorivita iocasae TaxID=2803865 RepID=A0ABX7DRC0_9FLAO|nr:MULTISPECIES: AAA family ATPase [Aequorivita]QQX76007.1 AAA family ATPase [Aequorivita iocasae]UCA55468.1 AAA family ATPase [Aequorivita sp. F7]